MRHLDCGELLLEVASAGNNACLSHGTLAVALTDAPSPDVESIKPKLRLGLPGVLQHNPVESGSELSYGDAAEMMLMTEIIRNRYQPI